MPRPKKELSGEEKVISEKRHDQVEEYLQKNFGVYPVTELECDVVLPVPIYSSHFTTREERAIRQIKWVKSITREGDIWVIKGTEGGTYYIPHNRVKFYRYE